MNKNVIKLIIGLGVVGLLLGGLVIWEANTEKNYGYVKTVSPSGR